MKTFIFIFGLFFCFTLPLAAQPKTITFEFNGATLTAYADSAKFTQAFNPNWVYKCKLAADGRVRQDGVYMVLAKDSNVTFYSQLRMQFAEIKGSAEFMIAGKKVAIGPGAIAFHENGRLASGELNKDTVFSVAGKEVTFATGSPVSAGEERDFLGAKIANPITLRIGTQEMPCVAGDRVRVIGSTVTELESAIERRLVNGKTELVIGPGDTMTFSIRGPWEKLVSRSEKTMTIGKNTIKFASPCEFSFYESGNVEYAYLKDKTAIIVGDMTLKARGDIKFFETGEVEACVLAERTVIDGVQYAAYTRALIFDKAAKVVETRPVRSPGR